MSELQLTEDGERAFGEAQHLCEVTNVAVVSPEHLLAAALLVLADRGAEGLPLPEAIAQGLVVTAGTCESALTEHPTFGSGARQALSTTATAVRQMGRSEIGALELALGTIASGEVNPMFYDGVGVAKTALLAALGS